MYPLVHESKVDTSSHDQLSVVRKRKTCKELSILVLRDYNALVCFRKAIEQQIFQICYGKHADGALQLLIKYLDGMIISEQLYHTMTAV